MCIKRVETWLKAERFNNNFLQSKKYIKIASFINNNLLSNLLPCQFCEYTPLQTDKVCFKFSFVIIQFAEATFLTCGMIIVRFTRRIRQAFVSTGEKSSSFKGCYNVTNQRTAIRDGAFSFTRKVVDAETMRKKQRQEG